MIVPIPGFREISQPMCVRDWLYCVCRWAIAAYNVCAGEEECALLRCDIESNRKRGEQCPTHRRKLPRPRFLYTISVVVYRLE